MDWTKILYLISAAMCLVIAILESNLLRKTKGLNGEVEDLLNTLKAMPKWFPATSASITRRVFCSVHSPI